MVVVALHLGEQRVDPLGVGDEHRIAHDVRDQFGAPVRRIEPGHQISQVHHADDVVGVLADHRDAAVARAHGQSRGLPHGLVRLDPHHVRARRHDLPRRGVPEFEDRLDHPRLVVGHHPALARHVDDLEEFDLRGEGAVAEPAAGRDGVADSDEQAHHGTQWDADHRERPRRRERERIGVLPAEGPRADARDDVGGHRHHDDGERDRARGRVDDLVEDVREQDRRGHQEQRVQEDGDVDVAGPGGEHRGQARRAEARLLDHLLHPRDRDGAQRRVERREQPGQRDEQGRDDGLDDDLVHARPNPRPRGPRDGRTTRRAARSAGRTSRAPRSVRRGRSRAGAGSRGR